MRPWLAWQRILEEGFHVFSDSVADLQLVAPHLEDEILARVLLTGAATDDDLRSLEEAISEERSP